MSWRVNNFLNLRVRDHARLKKHFLIKFLLLRGNLITEILSVSQH